MLLYRIGLFYKVLKVQVHRSVITRGLQIGSMRKRALHFQNIFSFLCRFSCFLLSLLTSLAILLQCFLLLYELLSIPRIPPNPPHAFLSCWKTQTTFDSFFLSAIFFLLKVHLPLICEIITSNSLAMPRSPANQDGTSIKWDVELINFYGCRALFKSLDWQAPRPPVLIM